MGCGTSLEEQPKKYAVPTRVQRRAQLRERPPESESDRETMSMSDLDSMFSEEQMNENISRARETRRRKSPGVPGVEPTRENFDKMIQLKLLAAELRDDTNDAGDGGYAASTVGGRSFPSGRDDEARDDEDEQASGPAEDLAQRPVHLDADNPAPVDKHTARRERRQKRIVESYLAGVDRCDIPPLDTPFLAPLCACTCRCCITKPAVADANDVLGQVLEGLEGTTEAPVFYAADARFDPAVCCAAHTCASAQRTTPAPAGALPLSLASRGAGE